MSNKGTNRNNRLTAGQLQAVLESTRLINSVLDIDQLLPIIVEEINRNLKADRSTLFLVDKQRREIWSKVLLGDASLSIRLPIGQGIAGHVARSGEIVNIPDAYQDKRFNPEVDRKSGYRTRTILCAPVRDKQGAIAGVVQVLNKRRGTFNESDVRFLNALAVHIAIAIENARLFQESLKRKALEDEMILAGEMQRFLLPRKVPQPLPYELFVYHQPARQAGGDYYDFFEFPEHLDFLVADVSGKGVSAALLMANLHAAFHALCNDTVEVTPLINSINRNFSAATAPDKYATLFFGRLNSDGHHLQYVNCGHIPPLLFRGANAGETVIPLDVGGLPVGFLKNASYRRGRVDLQPGDNLLICSDGITEAMSRRGNMFGTSRIVEFIRANLNLPLEEMGNQFLQRVFRFSRDAQYDDDITLLILRRRGD